MLCSAPNHSKWIVGSPRPSIRSLVFNLCAQTPVSHRASRRVPSRLPPSCVLSQGTQRANPTPGPAPPKGATKDGEGTSPPAASAGTMFGALALITGSTVGAGMLALPQITAPAGFVPTAAGLTTTWVLLCCEALLLAEVNLELMREAGPRTDGKVITLRQMAERTLGKSGSKLITTMYLGLSYCLLVAYMAKASEVIGSVTANAAPPAAIAATLCAATAGLFIFGGTGAADRLNQGLTSSLLALFGLILFAGFTQTDVPFALSHSTANWESLGPAVPIIFLSLVYHDLVPLICSLLGGDRLRVRTALILGSLIPLAMFLSWEAVALATVPPDVAAAANALGGTPINPLDVFISRSGPGVGAAVQGFSFFAVLTSFLATVMGLSETMRTEVPSMVRGAGKLLRHEGMTTYDEDALSSSSVDGGEEAAERPLQGWGSDPGRVLALAIAMGPPLAFTAGNPGAFLAVLSFSGGYGMTTLYGVLPPLMAWRLRANHSATEDESTAKQSAMARAFPGLLPSRKASTSPSPSSGFAAMMPGGGPVLAGVLAAAVGVGLTRAATDAEQALSAAAAATAITAATAAAVVAPAVPTAIEIASTAGSSL